MPETCHIAKAALAIRCGFQDVRSCHSKYPQSREMDTNTLDPCPNYFYPDQMRLHQYSSWLVLRYSP